MTPAAARPLRARVLLPLLLAGLLLAALAGASSASAAGAWWHLDSNSAPTVLPPGGEGLIEASATNFGYEPASASEAHPIVLTDNLPAGLEVLHVAGFRGPEQGGRNAGNAELELKCTQEGTSVHCLEPVSRLPYEGLEIVIKVRATATADLSNEVRIEGGEGQVPRASLVRPLKAGGSPAPFGVEDYKLTPENEDGSPDTQAGSHPFQLTSTLDLNRSLTTNPLSQALEPTAPALVRDLHFVLPPGLLGNVTVLPQCSGVDFATITIGTTNLCSPETAVGVAKVTVNEPATLHTLTESVPVFNLTPSAGEPARFGIEIDKIPVILNTAVRTGSDYAVEVSTTNTTQTAWLLGTQVTFWGVPADPRHNSSRGWECLIGGNWDLGFEGSKPCVAPKETQVKPFLTLPTSCGQEPTTEVTGDSWNGSSLPAQEYRFGSRLDGCNLLGFTPALTAQPDTEAASTPTGLKVDVRVPQESTLSATGLGEADVKDTTLTLPEGIQASPAAANGLLACSAGQAGFNGFPEAAQTENDHFNPDEASCPEASKIGTVKIKTPLLNNELEGSVYLASQDTNPFGSPLVLYLMAFDPVSGVRVKLAGEVQINQSTGQLTSTFKETPPVPFEELALTLFGGPRASQSTPPLCGRYTSQASFTPSSETANTNASSSFSISSGPGGAGCPSNPLPFAPTFQAGSTISQAGTYSPFSLTIKHADSDQALEGLTMHLPPGAAAMLSSVTPCPEPQAAEGSCGPESEIGQSTTSSGLGGEPFTLGGKVYLTTGYKGAPFGLTVVTPAVAGPFNLGNVIVRSTINVDPITAAVTITSDPFPTILKGVPVQLKQINVTVDRHDFEFNGTNCTPLAITGTLTGQHGGSEPVSSPFQVTNCASLPFKPKFTATAGGHASKPNGASLVVKVQAAGLGQANIQKVRIQLPKQLPSRLTTIQKACLAAVFNANPATCPEGSNIGYAIIHTPVLKNALQGPAYLVSHGGAAFPDVEFVLQGEGITLLLDGATDIKKGITYSRFESTPDAPFTTFETILPTGPHSAFTANVPEKAHFSLCGEKLTIPTEIVAQNGAILKQTTNVALTGCAKAKPLTRAQQMAAAMKACKKLKGKKKQSACESRVRKKYKAKKASVKKHKKG